MASLEQLTDRIRRATANDVGLGVSIKLDLKDATAGLIQVPELADGDVVHVSKRTLPPVFVIGLVTKPGSFPYPTNQEIRVLDALSLAGGCSNPPG